jgi:hypothetical protein
MNDNILYYPDIETVKKAIEIDDPLLVLVKHDSSEIVVSNIDDAGEHLILIRLINKRESELENYFRIVLNSEGADWTFVCPSNYKGITNREHRIKIFYNEGIPAIAEAIAILGYKCEINIPTRYRRHFKDLK